MNTIAKNSRFTFHRKKMQRKTGGSKNVFIISHYYNNYTELYRTEIEEIMESMQSQFGSEIHNSYSLLFRKRADAEKAWVYLTLRWT